MTRSAKGSARGATLIEVMVAMAIMAVGLLGVFQTSILANNQNAVARRQSAGSAIGTDLVEAVERLPYAHPIFTASTAAAPTVIFDRDAGELTYEWENQMPLLAAMPIMVDTDQNADVLAGLQQVSLVVTDEEDPANAALVRAKHVLINVHLRLPGGGTRQLQFFTAKYNPEALVGGTATRFTEI